MGFFTLLTPDGLVLSNGTVIVIIGIMFLYTFVGICAGFGGALTTMPLITLLLPFKNGSAYVGDCGHRHRAVRHLAFA
ncbi:Inner membrane protein [Cronobacter malonaticus 507]|nr:Inner membrane protein [Cronobacter malonaticus 507]